jgi:hypothetical protein
VYAWPLQREFGRVLGTGVLRMSSPALAAVFKSVSAIQCASLAESAATVAKFGQFVFCKVFDGTRTHTHMRAPNDRPWWKFWSRCAA